MCDRKKEKFPIGPLGLNEGYTPSFPQAPSLGIILCDCWVFILLDCPFPKLSEIPQPALLCGENFAHVCVAGGMTPMGSNFFQSPNTEGMAWASWEQAGWPSPDDLAYSLKRIERISNSHCEMVQ